MRTAAWRSSVLRHVRQRRLHDRRFHASSRALARVPYNSAASEEKQESTVRASTERPAGTSGRRLLRDGRAKHGVPPPPPIPNWFLKHNVRLANENRGDEVLQGPERQIDLRDSWNEEVVSSWPYHDLPASKSDNEEKSEPSEPAVPERGPEQPAGLTEQIKTFFNQHVPAINAGTSLSSPRPLIEKWQKGDMTGKQMREELRKIQPDFDEGPSTRFDPAALARLQAQALIYSAFESSRSEANGSTAGFPLDFHFYSTDYSAHDEIDRFVEDVASVIPANIIRLDANDIAELAGEYIDQDNTPGSQVISSLAYEVYAGLSPDASADSKESAEEDLAQPRDKQETESTIGIGIPLGDARDMRGLLERAGSLLSGKMVLSNSLKDDLGASAESDVKDDSPTLSAWQELKLEKFFSNLFEAVPRKVSEDLSGEPEDSLRAQFRHIDTLRDSIRGPKIPRVRLGRIDYSYRMALFLKRRFRSVLELLPAYWTDAMRVSDCVGSRSTSPQASAAPDDGTILYLRDLQQIRDTAQGEAIVNRLLRAISTARKQGMRIVLVGTSASPTTSSMLGDGHGIDDDPRLLNIALPQALRARSEVEVSEDPINLETLGSDDLKIIGGGRRRLMEINLRHIRDTIRLAGFPCDSDLFGPSAYRYVGIQGTSRLVTVAMPAQEIQRIVFFANGLRQLYSTGGGLTFLDVSIATALMGYIHTSLTRQPPERHPVPEVHELLQSLSSVRQDPSPREQRAERRRVNLDEIRKNASAHEKRLLTGVVNARDIKTGFKDVHAPAETIEALKTLTSLSLRRPEAFSYGVLANDRLPGLLLYGPPGTGKTLLAKAVAKESSATVMEVTGAQIYEKYVGEGEKMVRAVFSLARKLSPCIVFIDEADAIFASRSGQSRSTHREIINQFLREWDGMDDHGVFIMVATNRPFDLDDAVLRRLPRRLVVDLPTSKDREGILKIHLKGEQLGDDVDIGKLAEQTPFYSGSDLKNLCVSAALAAVREENDLLDKGAIVAPPDPSASLEEEASQVTERVREARRMSQQRRLEQMRGESAASHDTSDRQSLQSGSIAKDEGSAYSIKEEKPSQSTKFDDFFPKKIQPSHPDQNADKSPVQLPERRTLTNSHFDKALQEISASINEDMSSLSAMRKFDEKYGDRKGRKKKSGYGFGGSQDEVKADEDAARIRRDDDRRSSSGPS